MTSGKKSNTNLLIGIGITLSLAIFLFDLITPLGIANGFCYITVMLLSMWSNDKRTTFIAALTGIVLIIAGYFLSPSAPPVTEAYIAITNRLLSIAVLVICSFVIIKYKQIEQVAIRQHGELQLLTADLKSTNSELEERVIERTEVLENALKKLENSEAELKQSLRQEKELNELKSRFVSMASHEFRTPLATILTSLSLIGKYIETGDKEKQVRHIVRIKSAVAHLTGIINDVLSVSKLEEGGLVVSMEKFPVKDFVSENVVEMQLQAKQNQKIEYHHTGENNVILDKQILRHILLNLLSNAIKFSDEGSTVKVVTVLKNSDFTLTVEDSGIGISAEDQKHLFERFFRGHNASAIQGTGLGLCIMAKHVELMKGKIAFTSKLGEGTKFTIKFSSKEDSSIIGVPDSLQQTNLNPSSSII